MHALNLQDFFGDEGDYDYRLDKAFVSCGGAPDPEACKIADRDSWIGAVDSLEAMGGGDFPESQSIALYRACAEWDWGDGITKVSLYAYHYLLAHRTPRRSRK